MSNSYTLKLESDKGPLEIKWSNRDPLVYFACLQSRPWKNNVFDREFTAAQRRKWHQRWGLGTYDLPQNPHILDIGSGIAVSDLLLAQYLPDATFHLCDKNETHDDGPVVWNGDRGDFFYNSWAVVEDAIKSSGLDRQRFTLADPDVEWKPADLITSHWSWCFHYSVNEYIDRVMDTLKPGGKLFVTVRARDDEDGVQTISDRIKAKPLRIPFTINDGMIPEFPIYHPDIWAWDCLWVKP